MSEYSPEMQEPATSVMVSLPWRFLARPEDSSLFSPASELSSAFSFPASLFRFWLSFSLFGSFGFLFGFPFPLWFLLGSFLVPFGFPFCPFFWPFWILAASVGWFHANYFNPIQMRTFAPDFRANCSAI